MRPEKAQNQARLLSAVEVADLLSVELDTLYRYARSGQIRGIKLGNLWRFAQADIEAFISAHRLNADEPLQTPALLGELIQQAAARPGGRGTITCGGRRVSYAEIDTLSDRLAVAFTRGGVVAGDRVALLLPNSVEFVVACFAIWKVGAVLVAEDSAIRPDNLRYVLEDARPTALVIDSNVATRLEGMTDALACVKAAFVKDLAFALSECNHLTVESLDAALQAESDGPRPSHRGRPDDVVSITYTSGSTGRPKGVMHTHESWLASAEFTRDHPQVTATDTIVVPLPMHHAYAFRQILAYMLADAGVIIADIYQALKILPAQRPTAILLVPAACNIVLDHFSSVLREADGYLRYVEIGTSAMPRERFEQLRALLPTSTILLPYGLTEARVAFLQAGPDGMLNQIAAVSPGLEVRLIDGDGQPAQPGQPGEIVLRGRGLMKGYWGRDEAELEAIRTQGFRTGDMGCADERGRISLLGRADAMLKIGGRKVNPNEVEMTLNRHPAVTESAVVAVPDPAGILEQVLFAYVVLRKESRLSENELLAHCRKHLEPYKTPSRIHFRTTLPKSSVGKILRQALAADAPAK